MGLKSVMLFRLSKKLTHFQQFFGVLDIQILDEATAMQILNG